MSGIIADADIDSLARALRDDDERLNVWPRPTEEAYRERARHYLISVQWFHRHNPDLNRESEQSE